MPDFVEAAERVSMIQLPLPLRLGSTHRPGPPRLFRPAERTQRRSRPPYGGRGRRCDAEPLEPRRCDRLHAPFTDHPSGFGARRAVYGSVLLLENLDVLIMEGRGLCLVARSEVPEQRGWLRHSREGGVKIRSIRPEFFADPKMVSSPPRRPEVSVRM